MTERPWTKRVVISASVEVEPVRYLHRDRKVDADDLARDLKRLFDDHATWRGTPISVRYESEVRCTFCGLLYEEDESGIPMCCDRAQQAHSEVAR